MNPEPDKTGRASFDKAPAIVAKMNGHARDDTRRNPDVSPALNASLVAVAAEDRRAFDEVYAKTVDRVLNLATRIVGDADAADDVASDVYLQVWRKAADFDPERGSAIAWIMTICRSRALDALRRKSVAANYTAEFERQAANTDVESGPQDLLAATDQESSVHQALQQLDAPERQLLALAYFRGYSHSELAAITGEPLGTVKTRIRRTLIKVRNLMQGPHASAGELR